MEQKPDEPTEVAITKPRIGLSESDIGALRIEYRKLTVLRLIIACLFGLAVGLLALSSGWNEASDSEIITYRQFNTRMQFKDFDAKVHAYRSKHGVFPSNLAIVVKDPDLADIAGQNLPLPDPKVVGNDALDNWGNPFVYTVQGDHYTILSYGEDGKPGGVGLDADLTSDKPHPPGSNMTFVQFLTEPGAGDMVQAGLVTSLVAGVLCFMLIIPKDFSRRSMVKIAVKLVPILITSVFVAMWIVVSHVPSGH